MQPPEVLTALTTPFSANGDLDAPALTTLLQRLKPLVDGVFVAGTTAEFPALSESEHEIVVGAALDVFGPQHTVVHVGAPSTRQALVLTHAAKHLGAKRFAAITPYYLNSTPQGITRHWGKLVDDCDGELYGYVFPDVATTDLLPRDLPTVLASGIAGLKVSATASTRVAEYLAHAPSGFKLWSGNDADLPNVMTAGGTGTVSGVSGVCPTPWAVYRDAVTSGDASGAENAQRIIEAIVPTLGGSIADLKAGLDAQGLPGGPCRMLIDGPSPDQQARITEAVRLGS